MGTQTAVRPKYRSLDDPEVWEDVAFLMSEAGGTRPNAEIARRCRVSLHALEKRVGARRHAV